MTPADGCLLQSISFATLSELLLPNGIGRTARRSVHSSCTRLWTRCLPVPASSGMQTPAHGWQKQRLINRRMGAWQTGVLMNSFLEQVVFSRHLMWTHTAKQTKDYDEGIRFTFAISRVESWSYFGARTDSTTRQRSAWKIPKPWSSLNGITSKKCIRERRG